jgi:hypothetical protein
MVNLLNFTISEPTYNGTSYSNTWHIWGGIANSQAQIQLFDNIEWINYHVILNLDAAGELVIDLTTNQPDLNDSTKWVFRVLQLGVDPCLGVVCPTGYYCVDGECVRGIIPTIPAWVWLAGLGGVGLLVLYLSKKG